MIYMECANVQVYLHTYINHTHKEEKKRKKIKSVFDPS